jgi:hypothetical protein
MKHRKLKLFRVCGVTYAADTCGDLRVVLHPDDTLPNSLDYLYKSPHATHARTHARTRTHTHTHTII